MIIHKVVGSRATGWRIRCSNSVVAKRFSMLLNIQIGFRPHRPSHAKVSAVILQEYSSRERRADHSPPSSAKV